MKTRQINKLAAFVTLAAICRKGQPTWTTLKAFADTFAKFAARVETLEKLKLQQSEGTTGIAAQKQQCREDVCSAGATVAGGVLAWAEDTGNLEVAGKVDFSESDLLQGRDMASRDKCQTVHDVAEENVASLGKYGVDEDVLEDLQEKVTVYDECISKPREAIATGKTVTKQIATEFRAADRLLSKGLDGLSLKFKKSAPGFYQDYWNARRIVDIAATHDTAGETSDATKKAA